MWKKVAGEIEGIRFDVNTQNQYQKYKNKYTISMSGVFTIIPYNDTL